MKRVQKHTVQTSVTSDPNILDHLPKFSMTQICTTIQGMVPLSLQVTSRVLYNNKIHKGREWGGMPHVIPRRPTRPPRLVPVHSWSRRRGQDEKASRVGAETRQEQNCLKIGYFDALNMGLNKCKKKCITESFIDPEKLFSQNNNIYVQALPKVKVAYFEPLRCVYQCYQFISVRGGKDEVNNPG